MADYIRAIVEKHVPADWPGRAIAIYAAIERPQEPDAILAELDAFAAQVQAVRGELAASFGMDTIEFFHCGDEHCEMGFSVRRDELPAFIANRRHHQAGAPFSVYTQYDSIYHKECGSGIEPVDLNGQTITAEMLELEGGTSDDLWSLMLNPALCDDKHHDPTNCTACYVRRRVDEIEQGVPEGSL